MKISAASLFTLYLKTHYAHFNVTGPDFYEYHKLLDDLYKSMWESFDDIGEQIRALDMIAPASLSEFKMLSVINDFEGPLSASHMLRDLLIDNEKLIQLLNETNNLAVNHIGLQNFIQGLVMEHEKMSWMLRATVSRRI
jgi:starvation-inducible DNA-binding protein